MSPLLLFRLTPAAAAICLLAHLGAQAQTPDAPSAGASAASSAAPAASASATPEKSAVSELTTVVVTAKRASGFTSNVVGIGAFRDQLPVDVPLTNNVVTRDVLDAQSAKSVGDAVRNTAGVTQLGNSSASYDNLAIRGIAMENRSSYRLDGSLPLISLVAIPMEDKERVEVLKGASSMYYGLVPPSGIVSFEMKRAGPKPVTSISTTVNQYGGYDVGTDLGRRFGEDDKFGVRINLVDGKDDPGLHNYHGRRRLEAGAFDFRVIDNLTFRLDLENYQKKSTEQSPLRVPASLTSLPAAPDNRTNLGADWAVLDAKATNALARVDWGFSENWNLTADYGEAHASRSRSLPQVYLLDPSTGDASVSTNFLKGQRYTNKNARIDFSGRVETGPIAHELVIGYTRNLRFQDSGDNYGTQGSTNGSKPQFLTNLYDPATIPLLALTTTPTAGTTTEIVDKGVYAVDRLLLSKQWQVIVGVRHEDYASYTISQASGTPPPKYSISDNSPNVSVIYKPTPNNSIYASRLVGLDVGQTVVQDYFNGGSLLTAAKTKQTEIGYKHQLGGLLLQGAFFNIEKAFPVAAATDFCGATKTDAEAAAKAADPTRTQVVGLQFGPDLWCVANQTQGGQVRYRGLELAASGDINRNFGMVASAMFMNAKVTKDPSPPATNLEGTTPGNTPKTTFSLFGEYRPDALPGFGVNAAAYYVGRRPVYNNDTAYLSSATLYSLGARYKTRLMSSDATFAINIDNLLDKSYWAAGDSVNATPSIAAGLPRMIRASATLDF